MKYVKQGTVKHVRFKGAGRIGPDDLPLAPRWLLCLVFIISFSLPNLVFSGKYWFDTLHLMKWAVTMAPVAVLSAVMGVRILTRGARQTGFTLDVFGAVWAILLLLVTLQPLFVKLSSISTYAKEWFYFACLFAVYILAYNLCSSSRLHRAILWGGSVNAAINVFFAELLIRHLNSGIPFILDVPDNYIGNTAQQEMFGLWTAMSVLNALFLHLFYVGEAQREAGLFRWSKALCGRLLKGEAMNGISMHRWPVVIANFALMSVNAWGLWSSTTRGAIASLLVAFVILVLGLWRNGERTSLLRALRLFLVVVILLGVFLGASMAIGTGRGNALVSKFMDMIMNPTSLGGRISIWRTSLEVFLKEPVTGVGLGQYKWHFLDGQRNMYGKYPYLYDREGYEWQFTYWAHSEYIQWACETGLIGSVILAALALWWLYRFVRSLLGGVRLPPEALWGISMTFLLWFDALFSRPFHRIENSVWMSLAFALANRSLLSDKLARPVIDSDFIYRCFGGMITAVSVFGLVFLGGGMMGDKLIYRAIAQPGNFYVKQQLLQRAAGYLMSRDDAREQLGELYVAAGKQQDDEKFLEEGFQQLYSAFLRRPNSKLLFQLFRDARDYGYEGLALTLGSYMRELRPASAEPSSSPQE
ncbi:MAG: O-antigen ligase family protein [Synergistaceae bacterium]|jgi:hypothetical protein|nr:O-antigen ligase family protein [Synergistaceae bacterium]